MCGIIGYTGSRNAAEILINGLEKLEYRGYDSAGIAVFDGDKLNVCKEKGRLENLKILLKKHPVNGNSGIGHTRWATHGAPSKINSHPHTSMNGKISVVHNGIIENYREIKVFLEENGYKFISDTDTEVVPNLIDFYYEGDFLCAVKKAVKQLNGSYALGIICSENKDELIAVRKDSPLIIGIGENENFIASDIPAILSETKKVYFLNDNEFAVLTSSKITVTDFDNNIIEKEIHEVSFSETDAQKGGYEHFMLKEIHEQPTAVSTTIMPRISDNMPDFTVEGFDAKKLAAYKHIFIVACGTAMHAGMVGKYVIEKLARMPVVVDIASEFRYRDPLIAENDLMIVISQSGETADTKAALELAKSRGADTLAIVNVKGSSIAREADMVVYTHAGPEISVASTKAYMVQVAIMYLIAFEVAYGRGQITKEECERLTREMAHMPEVIEEAMCLKEQCQYAASKLLNADSLLYIGRGLDYALSMEGSLKLKEISYIHSESYAAGELKHGTISLITENMPVIAVVTQKGLEEKTISNIKEVKARGAMVVLIAAKNIELEDGVADIVIRLPEGDELLTPMVAAVPLQLLAYYTSVLKGNDVDKPRNLAKSVTVE